MTLEGFIKEYVRENLELHEYEMNDAQVKKIAEHIFYHDEQFGDDLNTFLGSLDDAIEDTIDHLNYERVPFKEDEEKQLEEFFEKGQFIVAPGLEKESEYSCYLWEDFEKAKQFYEGNPDVHIYTLVDGESGTGYISKGARWANRIAYLISTRDAGLGEDSEIRFW